MLTGTMQKSANVNIFMGGRQETEISKMNKSGSKGNTQIYAGGLNLAGRDSVEMKKQQAQKQAMKLIKDNLKSRNELDKNIDSIKEKKSELSEQLAEANKEIEKLESIKVSLKEEYGIADNSEEQQNLERIEKLMFAPDELSEEDFEKLGQMESLTEYQEESLKISGMQVEWKKIAKVSEGEIFGISKSVESMTQATVRDTSMIKVKKMAQDIIESAQKEIQSMLIDETKEHIDEKIEEEQEKAEELEEAKELKEELQGSQSGQGSQPNAVSEEAIQDLTKMSADLEKELEDILKKNHVIQDDLKGITVDKTI